MQFFGTFLRQQNKKLTTSQFRINLALFFFTKKILFRFLLVSLNRHNNFLAVNFFNLCSALTIFSFINLRFCIHRHRASARSRRLSLCQIMLFNLFLNLVLASPVGQTRDRTYRNIMLASAQFIDIVWPR